MKFLAPSSLLIVLILSFTNTTYAQNVGAGIKAGVNMATIGGDASGTSIRPAFHAGAYYTLGTGVDWLYIQPEILYSSEGARVQDVKGAIAYSYINVPILLKMFPSSDAINFQIGPQLSINTGGEFIDENKNKTDVSDQLSEFIFGLTIGVASESANGINLAMRFNLGLSNNVKEPIDGGRFVNNVLQVSLGYTF